MKYLTTLIIGLLGCFALWALWGYVLLQLGLVCLGMRAYIAAILAIATAFLGLVGAEAPKGEIETAGNSEER